MDDLATKLRASVKACRAIDRSSLLEEAAAEIERLQSMTRFYERALRSGDVATLTDAERSVISFAADAYALNDDDHDCWRIANTLRGLLERTK